MEKVTISRYWNNPEITIKVTNKGISLEMDMNDFIYALKQTLFTEQDLDNLIKLTQEKIGSVTWTFRDATKNKQIELAVRNIIRKKLIDDRIQEVVDSIIKRVKEESAKVMG